MKIRLKYNKVNNKDIALITGNIAKLYEEGIPFIIIFKLIRELPLSREYKDSIYSIEEIIHNGGTLEEAFKTKQELYSDFFTSIVGIGEKTGKISDVLKVLESYNSRIVSIKRIALNAVTYPIILMSVLVLLFLFMVIVMIPNFVDIYISMGKEIPQIFKFSLIFSKVLTQKPLLAIIYLFSWGIFIPYLIIGKLCKKSLLNIMTKVSLYRTFTEYVAILLISVVIRSGINLSTGLSYCGKVKLINKSSNKIEQINKDIIKGKTLTESMIKSGIFSKYTLAHIKLGEETGTLGNKVQLLENELFESIILKINRLVENLQPFMIVLIGIIILSFILTFITPISNVMDVL